MPNILTNVLGGIQNVAKGLLPSNFPVDFEGSPPANRDFIMAYALLVRKLADGTKVPVGAFIPELYVLADTEQGSLRCQIEERAWKAEREAQKLPTTVAALQKTRPDLFKALYRQDADSKKFVRKSAFELAICPSHKQRVIERHVEKEYRYRQDNRLPFPAMVSKYRVGPDYLQNIEAAGLELKEFPGNCKVNLLNPNPTKSEKIYHYLGQNLAYLVTFSAALAMIEVMMLMGVTSPVVLGLGVVGTYLAKKTGNDFGLYDVAEGLIRDLGWLTSKDLGYRGKFSIMNALGTGIYVAAIGVAAFFAVTATWGGSLALPWAVLAKTGMGATAITALQTGFAGLFAGIAGLGAVLGAAFPIRYFWGMSVFDNQIHLDKKVADALPVLNTEKDFKASLAQQQEKLLSKLNKSKYEFTDTERKALSKEINATYLGWKNRFGAHPAPKPQVVDKAKEPRRSPRLSAKGA